MGSHSRTSNLDMTKEDDWRITEALKNLSDSLEGMGIVWETIKIEVVEKCYECNTVCLHMDGNMCELCVGTPYPRVCEPCQDEYIARVTP